MNKEALRTLRKTIASPIIAIGIGLSAMAGGTVTTAIEQNVHKTEQPSVSKGEQKAVGREVLIFDRNSLIARHVQIETNQRESIKTRGALAMLAGGGVLGMGIRLVRK